MSKPPAISRPSLARQLSLPSLRLDERTLPPSMTAPLLAASGDARALDLLVYLRCPGCRWQQALRVPARSRAREPRLLALLPPVPVRHWVFSLGESAQPYLVAQPRLRTRVARACVMAVFARLRRAAAREGVPEPWRCGAVSAVHRVGATLEANVHVHALVLDGVYAPGPTTASCFHRLPVPQRAELQRMLAELRATLASLLARAEPSRAPGPVGRRASTREVHRVAPSPAVVRPVLDPGDAVVHRVGELDVRAGAPVAADDQALRARLCRYVARAPFDPAALELGDEGRLRYRLHHPFADGTTHVELSPQALAERLQALAAGELRPPVAFHGVLAPEAAQAVLGATPTDPQLALLERPPRVPRARSPGPAPLCPRCQRALEVVSVEPAPMHPAA